MKLDNKSVTSLLEESSLLKASAFCVLWSIQFCIDWKNNNFIGAFCCFPKNCKAIITGNLGLLVVLLTLTDWSNWSLYKEAKYGSEMKIHPKANVWFPPNYILMLTYGTIVSFALVQLATWVTIATIILPFCFQTTLNFSKSSQTPCINFWISFFL